MNTKKFVSLSSTAVVFSLLHILYDVEWEYDCRIGNYVTTYFKITVPDVRLECLMYFKKIPVCTVGLCTSTNLKLPILLQEY